MTVREFIELHPGVNIDDGRVAEGYGDGWIDVENALDEEIQSLYFDEARNYAEISV